jgi:AraC-like DNA-binding protein/PAS domain-containing protein
MRRRYWSVRSTVIKDGASTGTAFPEPTLMLTQRQSQGLQHWRQQFLAELTDSLFIEAMFDRLPDIVFAIKDRLGRYVAISEACVRRCGLQHKQEAIGKTVHELFPADMASRYAAQDERVFRTAEAITDNLDLTLYPDRSRGWCLTTKQPLFDRGGHLVGLACISKDLTEPSREGFVDPAFASTIDYLHQHFDQSLTVEQLAELAGLSPAQFERRMRRIFLLSTTQYLIKLRIDNAIRQLSHTGTAIAEIARACGYCDQSALTRQMRQFTGMSPRAYRHWAQQGLRDQHVAA